MKEVKCNFSMTEVNKACKEISKVYCKAKKNQKVFSTFKNSGLSFSTICTISKHVKERKSCSFLTNLQKNYVMQFVLNS